MKKFSEDPNQITHWAFHPECKKYHPHNCINEKWNSWKVLLNDSELASKANEIDDNKFYDTDDTIKINCRKIFDSFQCDFAMEFFIISILLRSII